MAQEFDAADFKEMGPTEGMFKLEVMGQVEEIRYKAKNFINRTGTVGYAAVTVDEKMDFMFLSRTEGGIILTIPGDTPGPLPFPIEGYRAITITDTNDPIEKVFSSHVEAMGGDDPIPDEAWLRSEVPQIPHRVSAVMSKLFETALKAMGDMMEGMGQALGEAMGQVVGGFQEAFDEKVEEKDEEEKVGGEDEGDGLVCVACGAKIRIDETACPQCGERIE